MSEQKSHRTHQLSNGQSDSKINSSISQNNWSLTDYRIVPERRRARTRKLRPSAKFNVNHKSIDTTGHFINIHNRIDAIKSRAAPDSSLLLLTNSRSRKFGKPLSKNSLIRPNRNTQLNVYKIGSDFKSSENESLSNKSGNHFTECLYMTKSGIRSNRIPQDVNKTTCQRVEICNNIDQRVEKVPQMSSVIRDGPARDKFNIKQNEEPKTKLIATYLNGLQWRTDLAENLETSDSDTSDECDTEGLSNLKLQLEESPEHLMSVKNKERVCVSKKALIDNERSLMASSTLDSGLEESFKVDELIDDGEILSDVFFKPGLSRRSEHRIDRMNTLTSVYSDNFLDFNTSTNKLQPTGNECSKKRGNGSNIRPKSLGNIKKLLEQNLVATLIGLYVLVSLTLITVLVLPYIFSPYQNPNMSLKSTLPSRITTLTFVNGNESTTRSESTDLLSQADKLSGRNQGDKIPSENPFVVSDYSLHDINITIPSIPISGDQTGVNNERAPVAKESTTGIPTIVQTIAKQKVQHSVATTRGPESKESRGKFREMWNIAYGSQCQPLKVPLCAKTVGSMVTSLSGTSRSALVRSNSFGVAYDMTIVSDMNPNGRQSQVEKILAKFEPVIDIKCYPLMPLFLCSIYAPKCIPINETEALSLYGRISSLESNSSSIENSTETDDERSEFSILGNSFTRITLPTKSVGTATQWSRLVPPCRSICREALRRCTFFFEVLSLKLLDPEDCDSFPESSDPQICVGQAENNLLLKNTELQACQGDKFRCSDGGCIPKKWRCDGFADCTDKTDEDKCSRCKMDSQFYCGQDICISKTQVCNGIRDCKDGRDERQCLRLSNSTSSKFPAVRQLEVWNAAKNKWLQVCGTHWSPTFMSHEACQILGFSRANQTVIVYGPLAGHQNGSLLTESLSNWQGHNHEVNSSDHRRDQTNSNKKSRVSSRGKLGSTENKHLKLPDQSRAEGGWFDLTNLRTRVADGPGRISVVEDDRSDQPIGVFADIDGLIANSKTFRSERYDHSVSYERIGRLQSPQDELSAIDADETKLRSITSILYHGPETGCTGRALHLNSAVHLQCENFQCGRSVTSYSSRVPRMDDPQIKYHSSIKRHHSRHWVKRSSTEELNETESFTIQPKRWPQHLDASEELENSSGRSEDSFGLPSGVSSRLVVGGTESIPGEFPYLAALHGGPDEVFFCGGVLISINWLLTAAHCVGNRTQAHGWMVKVGITRRIASPAFVRKLTVRKIIKHPNFNEKSIFDNDIALILLEESVEFNQYLRPICLPRANLKLGPDNSKDCVVVGFGKSKFSQEANYLHVAHFVNVPIVRHSICSGWYAEHGVNLTEGMLCAGYAEGKRDACQGDSGSGLFCRYSNTNQFFVAGVVSFGIKCATPKLPGVYTSVPLYVDWIEATTREHGYPLE